MTVAISFTGQAKKLTQSEKSIIEEGVGNIKGYPDLFFSGAARGVDIWAARCAIRKFPEAKHIILIPTWCDHRPLPPVSCKHDKEGIGKLSRLAAKLGVYMEWKWCPAGYGSEDVGLMRRNDVLAVNCTHMLAFPATNKEQQRSGTWATVRRGFKLNRPVRLTPLNGDSPTMYRPR